MPPVTRAPSRLRNVRKARTLTQIDMARLIGVSQSVYHNIEAGKIRAPVDVQIQIAAILGVSPADVFPAVGTEVEPESRTA